MKRLLIIILLTSLASITFSQEENLQYIRNRAPLIPKTYLELPIGSIKPAGWLKDQLIRMKNGATGHLDELYPEVMGKRNGWLGGDGDQWERGPYWIDGLLPLAYILNDKNLIDKVKPWIEWTINSQKSDGYFGPDKDYPNEPGLQRDNSHDWWPKMVMLKVLRQYYMATGDKRVITLLTNYFRYQLNELPKFPLGHWSFWAEQRAGDNLGVVYWLYNITGDSFLLDLAEIINKQAFDWTNIYLNSDTLTKFFTLHTVNVAQGIKEPAVYYQQSKDKKYIDALTKGFKDLNTLHGLPNGMYSGDEWLHGANPTQGTELCAVVEMMYSLETILSITGDVAYADRLEKIAYNALPTQITDDFLEHQYFQQVNQVMISRQRRNFLTDFNGTDQCFGLMTGYPCCTSNMHQGWPKFTQNLWYATADSGLAALLYAPSEVTGYVASGKKISITEETNYPFEESISFKFNIDNEHKSVLFPLHLRIPSWCKKGIIKINGQIFKIAEGNRIEIIKREWSNADVLLLELPLDVEITRWYEQSGVVERGPLVFVLKISEKWEEKKNNDVFGNFQEVYPLNDWNYGLIDVPKEKVNGHYKVERTNVGNAYPWNLENAPLQIKCKAKKIPQWSLYDAMAGPLPYSPQTWDMSKIPAEEITLIPYGCSTLRITEFPLIYNSVY
ncbi:MAG: glycoside hydrolase family 127 protein [Ignavibacteriaceae bacterium]|nr:glycoside hydrolase family 127 protein [Ignavibacteriaceae bacterium]